MKRFKKLLTPSLLALLICTTLGCVSNQTKTDKKHTKRDNIIAISNELKVANINREFGNIRMQVVKDYLIIDEIVPRFGRGLHLYNRNTFEHITSTVIAGKGPGEVTRQGEATFQEETGIIWLADHGKMVTWAFPLDSVLQNPDFLPYRSFTLGEELFIERYAFVNDSIAIGKGVRFKPQGAWDMVTAQLNLNTGSTIPFGYEHPHTVDVKSNSSFALSKRHNIYVNTYAYCDLMTICDLDGNLKYNILGPEFGRNKDNSKIYFGYPGVQILSNGIIAAYLNDNCIVFDEGTQRLTGNSPSQLLVTDLEGNYLSTLDIGCQFYTFFVDEELGRLLIYLDGEENPFRYVDLKPEFFESKRQSH